MKNCRFHIVRWQTSESVKYSLTTSGLPTSVIYLEHSVECNYQCVWFSRGHSCNSYIPLLDFDFLVVKSFMIFLICIWQIMFPLISFFYLCFLRSTPRLLKNAGSGFLIVPLKNFAWLIGRLLVCSLFLNCYFRAVFLY